MYLVISSVLFLYICFAVETTFEAENGYIVFEMPEIPCKDPSSAIPACSGSLDYSIPDLSNILNATNLNATKSFSQSLALLLHLLGNTTKKCSKAGTKYLCERAYPFRCKDAYVEADPKEMVATCNEGRKDCSSLNATLRDSLFNCSDLANAPYLQTKIPRKIPCNVFPVLKNDPYSCEANYKVSAGGNVTQLNLVADMIAFLHRMLKSANIADVECEKNLADTVCKISIPACSKDQTKIVSLLSKQDCREIVGCVNKTNNANLIQTSHSACDNLPDGTTAKKYSLDNVYDNYKAAGPAMAFSTILFIATLVSPSFF